MLASIGAFSAQFGLVIPGYTANPDPVTNLNEFVVNYSLGFAQVVSLLFVSLFFYERFFQILFSIAVIEGRFFPGEVTSQFLRHPFFILIYLLVLVLVWKR